MQISKKKFKLLWNFGRFHLREIFYQKWSLQSYLGSPVYLETDKKVTVIIPSYHGKRARNLQPLVRSILKCNFVEKIIISNHNPEIKLEDWVKTDDSRVKLINHSVRRGCGYGWIIASQEKTADYFIVIDDDMLIYPQQLALLFEQLIHQPGIPHGLIGRCADGKYVMSQDIEVEFLYNIYAVTQAHIQKYLEYTQKLIEQGYASSESIEYWADDIIVSQTGIGRPKIHKVGFIGQCKTTKSLGVSTFTENQFDGHRIQVYEGLAKLKSEKTMPKLTQI
ncbi:MAG: glycosyltransferase family A protein [Microcoleaceae cyanobacterium MO_207.B10]|nr:glycosyltransferase family A protein [Microcoleaceae cyanobacterium MO_207.B10]